MKPVLEVKDVNKTFFRDKKPQMVALDGVSFLLHPGEILGIVGESGSGKSTIAKIVARLIDVTNGSIFLNGKEITHRKGADLRSIYEEIQMVFQSPVGSFDPRRSLGDGITAGLRNKGFSKEEARNKAIEALASCGLSEEFMDRYPHQVSGGQCQRAAIARALVVEPKILICDEATSALDVTIQKQVMELLQSIHKEREMSYLFICHNLALVQNFCDRILVMQNGKIVEQGTMDDIIDHPQAEYTKQLVNAVLL